jgi:hypothetical protein
MRWTLRAAWGAAGILLLVLACAAWLGPDIFYHLHLGRRVLETRSFQPPDEVLAIQPSYRNVYWLFQVVVYAAWSAGGVVAAGLLFAAAWAVVAALWARTAGLLARPAIGLPLALAGILVLQMRFEPRPEVFSYLLLALQVLWLSTWVLGGEGALGRAARVGATQVVWTNVHGYFIFGPFLAGARFLAALLGREGRASVAEGARLLAVAAAASFASPFGAGAWEFALVLARFLREIGGGITEFAPPTGVFLQLWTVKVFWVLWGATAAAGLWLLARRKAPPFALLTAAPALALSAASARNLPLLLLLAAPLWRSALEAIPMPRAARAGPRGAASKAGGAAGRAEAARHEDRHRGPRAGTGPAAGARRTGAGRPAVAGLLSVAVSGLAALLLAAWTVTGGFHRSIRSESGFGIRLPEHTYPLRFTEALRSSGWRGRVFNSAADGGYLELAAPEVTVYMDSRYIEAGRVREYFAALVQPAAFRRLDAAYRFEGALLKVVDSGPLVLALLADPGWTLAWGDLHRVFFVRSGGPPFGSAAPRVEAAGPTLGRVAFYRGQDLSNRVHGSAAIQWAGILAQMRDRPGFLEALEQFGRAPRIPSFVIDYALRWGLEARDPELIQRARALVPRMLALAPEHRAAVEALLRMAEPLRTGS